MLNVFLTFQRLYRLYVILLSQLRQLHTPTNLLLLSLAASDFLVGLLISFPLVSSDGCWYLGDHICVLYSVFDATLVTVPVGTMVLISIDRYVAICYPLHYHYKITVRRVLVVNVLCWVCSVLYVSVMLWDIFIQPDRFKTCQGECVIAFDDNEGIIDFVLIFVGPVSVIIVLYLRVFVVVVYQARAMRGQIRAVTLKRSEAVHVRKSELKAAGILGVVVVTFLSCYFPYYCSSLVGDFHFSSTAFPLQTWLPYFNSCLNPLIYAFCYPWFRKSVKLLLTLKILRRGSSRLNVLLYRLYVILLSQLRQLHTPTNLLLLSLAVSDFLVGLLISFPLVSSDGCWYLGDHICVLYSVLDATLVTVPVGTMVLISIDRYVAICYPLHYHYKITVRRVLVVNVLCWVCSVLYVSVMLWDIFIQPDRFKTCQGECVIAFDDNEGIIDFVLIFVGPVFVIIVLYLRVFVVAVSQARAMRGQIRTVTLKPSEAVHVRKSELKAAGILGVVVVTFLSCYFPYYCSSLVGDFHFSSTAFPLQTWLPYFNSCLNPLIYAFCYPWFRKSVKLLLTLKILRRGSSRLNVL
ncbi:unnamed protein product [Menidia menidia]|uniref:(Atlantic silverside) hypothetical protein n=1 Tax=Menidia menidia TaxID=238744 RepID=A0A8S4BN79_9TELE|nr:unnamed protein product [Menidia menidia]